MEGELREMQKLDRTVFEISRELEFFSEKELQMQIGHGRELWPKALAKELIDNGLDAAEGAGIAPEVEVTIEDNAFSVRDNGPGLSEETIKGSLNYFKRVSDKTFYVSPTRGQLGNALKVVWAAPFVANGDHGGVEVWSRGKHNIIEVSLDRLEQRPVINYSVEESPLVKNGTLVKVHWPDLACSMDSDENDDSYNSEEEEDIEDRGEEPTTAGMLDLVKCYAAFNPHATFRFVGRTEYSAEMTFEATDPKWTKWEPTDPTSAHWYTPETLRDLIAAYVSQEKQGGRVRTVREFVSEFRGLSGTAKQKQLAEEFKGTYLHDLINGGDIDPSLVEKLLEAMKKLSNEPKPTALGVIGQDHLKVWMVRYADVSEKSFKYSKRLSTDGLPHVLEIGFGIHQREGRRIVTGLNWAPTLVLPTEELGRLLGQMRIDKHDPVTVVVHTARPRFEFVDRGKTRLEL
jgi:DNA topoisomerase VI subunit B